MRPIHEDAQHRGTAEGKSQTGDSAAESAVQHLRSLVGPSDPRVMQIMFFSPQSTKHLGKCVHTVVLDGETLYSCSRAGRRTYKCIFY
jgi:hypothetical protein